MKYKEPQCTLNFSWPILRIPFMLWEIWEGYAAEKMLMRESKKYLASSIFAIEHG